MQIITFFATKGGVGRTTCTMALACGLLAAGKKVMVLDCTDEYRSACMTGRATTHEEWYDQMVRSGADANMLMRADARTAAELQNRLAQADDRGADLVLIDTSNQYDAQHELALACADLVIAPAIGPLEADIGSRNIHMYCDDDQTVFGLVSGSLPNDAWKASTRTAFRGYPVFVTELPFSAVFSEQVHDGDLAAQVAALRCGAGDDRFAEFKDIQKAWVTVQQWTFEVLLVLAGYQCAPIYRQRYGAFGNCRHQEDPVTVKLGA